MNHLRKMRRIHNFNYFTAMALVAINTMIYMTGSHLVAFMSTSLMLALTVWFTNKTHKTLYEILKSHREILDALKKVDIVVRKLSKNEQENFRKIYESL